MKIYFLLPDIQKLTTGGNNYNRNILADLRRQHPSLKTLVCARERLPAELSAALQTDPVANIVVLVDSLLVQQQDLLRELRRFSKLVLVTHYLQLLDPERAAADAAEKERLSYFDGFIVTSLYARSRLIMAGVNADTICTAPPGLDPLFRGGNAIRDLAAPPRILTVSNLLAAKGLLEMLKMLEGLRDLSWRWELVGSDETDPAFARLFQQRLRESPVRERVEYRGVLAGEALLAAYDQSAVLAHPSFFESCGMVVREGLARSLPVVAFDTGGIAGNFSESTSGFLAPLYDWVSFAKDLRALLVDPDLRSEMGANGCRTAEGFPEWRDCALKISRFLLTL